jgi:magnesium chelatase family protein
MFTRVISGAVSGVEGYPVQVEVDIASGLPGFDIVGLPDSAVKEARERVRTAIRNSGHQFPVKQITVNLAPADTRKSGPAFDLPVAVGILICTETLPQQASAALFTGELSLDGEVKPVAGVLPIVLSAKEHGVTRCFVPFDNAREAALVEGIEVYPLAHLNELTGHFSGKPIQPLSKETAPAAEPTSYGVDFSDVMGQANVKRALEIAAAGYHNVLMVGPPGAGKTMMARRLPTIMPELSVDESLEITRIYSIAGLLDNRGALMTQRPFRTPHHTASYVSLTGGGRIPSPGEVSLAHHGVLFLDELPEFQKRVLESLRQPMEDGQITIARAGGVNTYPSEFLLLGAMNPCPCGYHGTGKCKCTENEIAKYLSKISGPLLDRIDIQVEAAAATYSELDYAGTVPESSSEIKARVERTRLRQKERFKNESISFNAKMSSAMIKKYCPLGREARSLIKAAYDNMALSARAYHKIIKMARTIADFEDADEISAVHLAEAISYRSLDRRYW